MSRDRPVDFLETQPITEHGNMRHASTALAERRCTCQSYHSARKWRCPGILTIRSELASNHFPSRPLYASSKRASQLGIDLDVLWLWTPSATSCTLEIVRGAGNCVRRRALVCRSKRIVTLDSPAFRLFERARIESSAPSIQEVRSLLDQMFRNGDALPTDESVHGCSMLHVGPTLILCLFGDCVAVKAFVSATVRAVPKLVLSRDISVNSHACTSAANEAYWRISRTALSTIYFRTAMPLSNVAVCIEWYLGSLPHGLQHTRWADRRACAASPQPSRGRLQRKCSS